MTNFKGFFDGTPETSKLRFLAAIIRNNNNLQEEFINFTKQEDTNNEDITGKQFIDQITEAQEQYQKSFEKVDLENPDWDNYNPPHSGYIDEWEQYQQASEQEFEIIFDEFKQKTIDCIIQQRIDNLTGLLLGLYEACLNAEIVDEVDSFDDVNNHLAYEHKRIMLEIVAKVKMSAISSNKIYNAIKLFFEYCDIEYPGNTSFPNYFEPLLLALADVSDQPNKLLSLIDASKAGRDALPQLVLMLCGNTGNDTEWLQSARQYYLTDNEVAKQLINYYFENDKENYLLTAKVLFEKDKNYWSRFLQHSVDLKLDKNLFIKVFYQLTINEKDTSYYNEIKDHISSSEFDKLLLEISWDKAFVVKILEVEKRYEKIKQIVEQSSDNWSYTELITPILSVYPAFCFNNIKTKAVNTLQNERGRSIYKQIASWLLLCKQIPKYETQTRELILQLYNHKPNLPALKGEFRIAGLM